jgi:glycosyltransferase involved in cell wall biosynthesis
MKILLIGPVPPPYGGISVHVMGIYRRLNSSGVPCLVLDPARGDNKIHFARTVARYAAESWTIHVHANGHNWKSWLLAMWCAAAGRAGGGFCILTLHSGLLPEYLHTGIGRRKMAALACRLYSRIVCVSPAIRESIVDLGIDERRTETAPASLGAEMPKVVLESLLVSWISRRRPLLSTALFFRPEYGFHVLVVGLRELRRRHPNVGCLVMGSGEGHKEALALLREAKLEGNVLLLGDVDHERCLAIMSRSHVFVRPTLQDGDSISVREAQALGVPVVASRVGCRPEGVLLFEPGSGEEMAEQVERALQASGIAASHSASCMERLMQIYRDGQAREEGLCQKAC